MAKPILPPQYVNVPSQIVFDKTLQPAVRDTYIQIKALAWGNHATPPMTFKTLAGLTGKSVATLYGHLRILKDRAALQWRAVGDSTFIFSFSADGQPEGHAGAGDEFQDSRMLETPNTPPLFDLPPSINTGRANSRILESKKPRGDPRSQNASIQSCKTVTGRYPPKELYDKLIATLGDAPDLGRLRQCREAWVERGYNGNGWAWALEWYRGGIPVRSEPTKGQTHATHQRRNGGADDGKASIADPKLDAVADEINRRRRERGMRRA